MQSMFGMFRGNWLRYIHISILGSELLHGSVWGFRLAIFKRPLLIYVFGKPEVHGSFSCTFNVLEENSEIRKMFVDLNSYFWHIHFCSFSCSIHHNKFKTIQKIEIIFFHFLDFEQSISFAVLLTWFNHLLSEIMKNCDTHNISSAFQKNIRNVDLMMHKSRISIANPIRNLFSQFIK